MKIGKKLIALFLSVVMVMSLLPVAALAEGESEPSAAAEDTGATVTYKPTITWSRTKELVYNQTGLGGLYAGSKTDYEKVTSTTSNNVTTYKGTIKWDFEKVSDALNNAENVTGNDNVWDYNKETQYTDTNPTTPSLGIKPVTGISAATWNNRHSTTHTSDGKNYEQGLFDDGTGNASSYTVRKISGTFTWPEGYGLDSKIELVSKNDANYSEIYAAVANDEALKAAFGGKKVIAVNDDMYVFIYKEGATLTSKNYTDYLAFWTGTAGKGVWSWPNSNPQDNLWGDAWNQTQPATFNNENALRAFYSVKPNLDTTKAASSGREKLSDTTQAKMNQSDYWYAFADGNAISTVLNNKYSNDDFKGSETYHIDIYCFDTDKVGGMDELELKLTKAADTQANVTVRYWFKAVGTDPTNDSNFLGETTMAAQTIGSSITLADGTATNQLNYRKAAAITKKNSNKDVRDGEQMNELVVSADSDKNIINVLYVPAGDQIVHLWAGNDTVPYDGNEHEVKDVTIKETGYADIKVDDSVTTRKAELNDRKNNKNVVCNITAQGKGTLPGIYDVKFDADTSVVKNNKEDTILANYTVYQHPGKLTITYEPQAAVCTYDFGVENSYDILNAVEKAAAAITADSKNVKIVDGKVHYTPAGVNIGETVKLTLTYAGNYTCTKEITFQPATNVLYEENFMKINGTNDNWKTDGTAASPVVDDNEKLVTDENGKEVLKNQSVYGYASEYDKFDGYSNGAALKANLTLPDGQIGVSTKDAVTFSFTGTGFDLISECGTDTGILIAQVTNTKTNKTKIFMVDTYFCGDGEDGIISGTGVLAHQVPVIRDMDLDYGTYDVTVYGYLTTNSGASVAAQSKGLFSTQAASVRSTGVDTDAILRAVGLDEFVGSDVNVSFMDENSVLNGGTGPVVVETPKTTTSKLSGILSWFKSLFSSRVSTQAADESTGSTGSVNVYVDAFRVYKPLNDDETNYADSEKGLKYGSFYDYVVGSAQDIADNIDGSMVYMEYDGEQDIAVIKDYKTQGPQNEIYLSEGNYVGFVLDGYTKGKTVMVSAKAVQKGAILGYTGSDGSPDSVTENDLSATEMYYDVTKYVQEHKDEAGNTEYYYLILGNNGEGVLSLSGIKLEKTITPSGSDELAPLISYEKNAQKFNPDKFEIKHAASVKVGKKTALNIRTSLNVDCVEVFYDEDCQNSVKGTVYPNNKKAVANGRATEYSFNVSVPIKDSTNTFYVVAYNAIGDASAPVVVTITGR